MSTKIKLGGGSWGVKENGLLAYNDEDNIFKAIEMNHSRSSTATRVDSAGLIADNAIGVPRIDFSDGGALLLEPQSTNLVTYSEDLSSAFTPVRCTITSDQITSPDGTLTADLITSTDSVSENYLELNSVSTISTSKQTLSYFVKKGTSDFVHILLWDTTANGARQWFDLTNGLVGSSTSFGSGISVDSAKIEDYENGWYRVSAVFNNTSNCRVRISPSNADSSLLSTSGNTFYAWGAQLEELSYATSYIPTSGATATRIAETCSKSGLENYINSSEGVLYVEAKPIETDSTDNSYLFLNARANPTRYVGIRFRDNLELIASTSAGIGFDSINMPSDTFTSFKKYAIVYSDGRLEMFVNGVKVLTDTTFSPISTGRLDEVIFGGNTGGVEFYGKVKDLRVYDTALTDAELQALTS